MLTGKENTVSLTFCFYNVAVRGQTTCGKFSTYSDVVAVDVGGTCYYGFRDYGMSWTAAQQRCLSGSTHLAFAKSVAEQQALYTALGKTSALYNTLGKTSSQDLSSKLCIMP
jgi:hypothetical protein